MGRVGAEERERQGGGWTEGVHPRSPRVQVGWVEVGQHGGLEGWPQRNVWTRMVEMVPARSGTEATATAAHTAHVASATTTPTFRP